MAERPEFAVVPRIAIAQVTTANTNRDGSGGIVAICTGQGKGTKIDEVIIQAVGTTTAGMVRLYINDGTNTRLFDEIAITAITPSATVQAFRSSRVYSRLVLPGGYILYASTEKTETFNIEALAGDL